MSFSLVNLADLAINPDVVSVEYDAGGGRIQAFQSFSRTHLTFALLRTLYLQSQTYAHLDHFWINS